MRLVNRAIPTILAVLAALPAGPARADATDRIAPSGALPADVTAYVDRRAGCNHWGGEEAYDKERGREIAAALKELNCERIEADEIGLRQRYARSPRILKAIDGARDRDG